MAPHFSAIREHCESAGHPLEAANFRIVGKTKQKMDLPILESLVIQNKCPSLNTLTSADLHLFRN